MFRSFPFLFPFYFFYLPNKKGIILKWLEKMIYTNPWLMMANKSGLCKTRWEGLKREFNNFKTHLHFHFFFLLSIIFKSKLIWTNTKLAVTYIFKHFELPLIANATTMIDKCKKRKKEINVYHRNFISDELMNMSSINDWLYQITVWIQSD